MNGKWPVILLVAFMALTSGLLTMILTDHQNRIAACENILMQGERGTDARRNESE